MHKMLGRVLVLSIASLVAHQVGYAAQQSAAGGTPPDGPYTVCVATNPGQYVSAPFASAGQPSIQERNNWEAAFAKFVLQKYNVIIVGSTTCVTYRNRAIADDAVKRVSASQLKAIGTGWNPSVVTSAAPVPTGALGICFSDPGRPPVYYSGEIRLDFDIAKQNDKGAQDPRIPELTQRYQQEFLAFLKSKYGYANTGAYPTACQLNMKLEPEVTALKARLASQAPSAKFIETGWLPGSSPAPAPAASASAPAATPAAGGPSTGIAGVYTGSYICGGRVRYLKLTVTGPENGLVTAHFTAYFPPDAHDKVYTFTSNGRLDPATGKFKLIPLKWDTAEPPNVVMVGMTGTFDPKANKVTGTIDYSGCTTFEAMRGRDN